MFLLVFFFKQKTAYEMRISDWSSDVCSSDLTFAGTPGVTLTNFFNTLYGALSGLYGGPGYQIPTIAPGGSIVLDTRGLVLGNTSANNPVDPATFLTAANVFTKLNEDSTSWSVKSEEHTSELQSQMRNTYAVFCLKKKNITRRKI